MNKDYFDPNIPSIDGYTHCTQNGEGEYIYWYSPPLSEEAIIAYVKALQAAGFTIDTSNAPAFYTATKNGITITVDPSSVIIKIMKEG